VRGQFAFYVCLKLGGELASRGLPQRIVGQARPAIRGIDPILRRESHVGTKPLGQARQRTPTSCQQHIVGVLSVYGTHDVDGIAEIVRRAPDVLGVYSRALDAGCGLPQFFGGLPGRLVLEQRREAVLDLNARIANAAVRKQIRRVFAEPAPDRRDIRFGRVPLLP
jgi:hypothetical protein